MLAPNGQYGMRTGLPPGSLVYLGEQRVAKAVLNIIDYDENSLHEANDVPVGDCTGFIGKSTVTWVNLTGIHDTELLKEIGNVFGIHPLVLEDIITTGQRPKLEDHGGYMFMLLKMLYRGKEVDGTVSEQVSIILGDGFVLTIQESEQDVFGVIRDRLRTAKGRIRRAGCDYLAYAIIDAIVDNYFVVLEEIGERVEEIQGRALAADGGSETLADIQHLKKDMVFLRRNLWPAREVAASLLRSESHLLTDALTPYIRDVYEHCVHIIDNLEILRDMVSGTLEIYMTAVSNRMNEVMKVLTIIATIFIPLTFVAGVYGMNFDFMPELHWKYGYAIVLLLMLAMAGFMVHMFRRRNWI